MTWQVLFLRGFYEDLEHVARGGLDPDRAEHAVREVFEDPFRAQRIEEWLTSGTPASGIDRLAGSQFPPSLRLHVLHDYRATAWCYPVERFVIVTHFFSKSADPDYRRALHVHDARIQACVDGLGHFLARKRKR